MLNEEWQAPAACSDTTCVEVRRVMTGEWRSTNPGGSRERESIIEVRNSRYPDEPPLRYTEKEWRDFIEAVKASQFDPAILHV